MSVSAMTDKNPEVLRCKQCGQPFARFVGCACDAPRIESSPKRRKQLGTDGIPSHLAARQVVHLPEGHEHCPEPGEGGYPHDPGRENKSLA